MLRPGVRAAGLVAAIPCLLASIAQMWPTQSTPIAAAPAPPSLAFAQYAVDYGRVPPRPVVQAWFEFTNTGEHPVTITALEPSCGCLNPQLFRGRTTYEPGEHGRFDIMLKTANEESGPHRFTVTVKYEDPRPREETVLFRLTLPEQKVTVDPPELVFYQLSGEQSEATVYVSDRRDGAIDVLAADTTLPGVTAEVLPIETGPDGQPRTPIRVLVPGVYPKGAHKGLVRIETSDPEFARLGVSVYVEGVEVQPAGFEAAVEGE